LKKFVTILLGYSAWGLGETDSCKKLVAEKPVKTPFKYKSKIYINKYK
jgi:hypothetical protein